MGKFFSPSNPNEISLLLNLFSFILILDTNVKIFASFRSFNERAIKLMEKDKIAENELDIISRLACPNVVKYFDHFYLIVSEFGKDVSYLCLVTEFCSVL